MIDKIQKETIYLDTQDDLKTALACFKVNKISHVPVVAGAKLVGMLSKTDVVEYLYEQSENLSGEPFNNILADIKVKQVMVQPVVKVGVNDSFDLIMEKLFDHKIGSVVVVEGEKVVGIATDKDVMAFLVSKRQEDLSFTEKFGLHLVQWLEQNGIFRISKFLGDIGV